MNNEDKNRLAMFRTVLTVLDAPTRRSLWENKAPVAFTRQVNTLRGTVTAIAALAQKQERDITGHAEDKEREEKELEAIAYEISAALSAYYEEKNNKAQATAIYLSASSWVALEGDKLLSRARELHAQLLHALELDAIGLADFDLDGQDGIALHQETQEFADVLSSPSAAISERRAQTQALRPHFRQATATLRLMDRTILRYNATPAGRELVAAYQSARIIRDTGHGHNPAAPTPPPA